jgi:hypothetical protein
MDIVYKFKIINYFNLIDDIKYVIQLFYLKNEEMTRELMTLLLTKTMIHYYTQLFDEYGQYIKIKLSNKTFNYKDYIYLYYHCEYRVDSFIHEHPILKSFPQLLEKLMI